MANLKALHCVLFDGKMYQPGDHLPVRDCEMVKVWLRTHTAVWEKEDVEYPVVTRVKAKPETAEPGLAGTAVSSESEDGVDLVGKVPKTASRSRGKSVKVEE